MTYNPNIPQAGDFISQSQSDILINFGQANTLFDVDHVTFNDAATANRGKHRQSTYPELGAPPTTLANEGAVYTAAGTAETELYFKRENSGEDVQLSIIRAWGTFFWNGASVTINDSFNISSISRSGNGTYVVNFTKNMRNNLYSVLATTQMTTAFTIGGLAGVGTRAVSNFQLNVKSLTAASGVDPNPISFMVIQS